MVPGYLLTQEPQVNELETLDAGKLGATAIERISVACHRKNDEREHCGYIPCIHDTKHVLRYQSLRHYQVSYRIQGPLPAFVFLSRRVRHNSGNHRAILLPAAPGRFLCPSGARLYGIPGKLTILRNEVEARRKVCLSRALMVEGVRTGSRNRRLR